MRKVVTNERRNGFSNILARQRVAPFASTVAMPGTGQPPTKPMTPDSHESTSLDRDRRRALKLTGLAATGSIALLAGCGDDTPGEEQEPDQDPESEEPDEEPAEPEGDDPEDDPTDQETAEDDENENGVDMDDEDDENGDGEDDENSANEENGETDADDEDDENG